MMKITCRGKTDIDVLGLMANLVLVLGIAPFSNQSSSERIRLQHFSGAAEATMVYAPCKRGLGSFAGMLALCVLTFSSIPITLGEGAGEASTAGSATASTCGVSDGDKAFGIQVIADPTCTAGGLGCYNDYCRYCKVVDTLKSSHLDSCTALGATFETNSSSSAGKEVLEVTTADVCTMTVSDGDAAVGINITTDESCANGGLGCLSNICRFCKAKNTTQSAYLADCPISNNVCTTAVSEGNAAVGINIVTDTTCAQGGVGCIDNLCRFCRVTSTVQSAPYVDCAVIVLSGSNTQAPATTTTSTAPAVTMSTPVTPAPTPTPTVMTPKQTCSQTVSEGDAAVGIKIVTDLSCAYGGVGCIDLVCRFCKTTTTVQSASFVDCTTIAVIAPTTAPVVTTSAPNPTTPAPTTSTPAPPVTTTTPASPSATSSTSKVCSIVAAVGDVAVGINVVTDITCATGGLGCIDTVCRFCKVTTTVQSAAYVDCATITGTTSVTQVPTVSTPAPTSAPTSASTTPSIPFVCSRTVSSGDKGVGLDIVSDVRCGDGGTGCLDDVCRFCKQFDTSQSQSYISCSSIPDSNIGADITFVPIPVVDDSDTSVQQRFLVSVDVNDASNSDGKEAARVCGTTVSSGDAAVGINIITDASCASGGLGCMDDICRLCKTTTTPQSAHLGNCSDYSPTATLVTAAPTTTTPAVTKVATTAPVSTTSSPAIQLQCYQTVSSGDKKLGINIVTDIRCGDGGVGCVDSACRFCKLFETTQSHSFLSCSDIPPAEYGSDINFVPIVAVNDTQVQELSEVPTDASTEMTSIPEACGDVELADGQAEGGIGVVLDTENCPQGLLSGCIGDTGCRYCKRFPTDVSEYLEYCADVNTSGVAYALSGPVGESTLSTNGDAIASGEDAASIRKSFFKSNAVPFVAGVVACIGVVAVIMVAIIGMKRTVKSLIHSGVVSPRNGVEGDGDEEEKSSPTALVASNVGEPGVSAEV